MKRVLDEFDRPIEGMYKDALGNVILKDDKAFNKYKTEIQKTEEVIELRNKVALLQNQMNAILEKLNG